MTVEWEKTYRILLDNTLANRKPSKKVIKDIYAKIPKSQILGFGYYDFIRCWYVLVYCPVFPPNDNANFTNISYQVAIKLAGNTQKTLPPLPPTQTPA